MEEWMNDALQSLRDEVDNQELEITNSSVNQFYASDGDAEYMVYQTEDDAETDAIERVREDLEENPEYFNQDWLMSYIDAGDFFEQIFEEWNLGYADDIESESSSKYANRLIEEMVEWDVMSEDEADSDEAEEIADNRKYDFAEALTQDQLSQGNDGFDYYENNFGREEAIRLVMENNLIDIDSASEGAVNVDGIGHFLSSYDGETIYLDNDAVAYRIN